MVLQGLQGCFYLLLCLRFIYPFYYNPFDRIDSVSDATRMWNNAESFLLPSMWRGYDPVGYQFYLYIVRQITGDSPLGIAFFTGILCAMLPWLWYRIARELLSNEIWALCCAIVIGLMPTLFFNYGFFMMETLLLNLTGAAFLLTLIYIRNPSGRIFLWQTIALTFAALTKITAIPLGVALYLFSVVKVRPSRVFLGYSLAIILLLVTLSGLRNAITTHAFIPFGDSVTISTLYARSGADELRYKKEDIWFRSAAIGDRPLAPFSDWQHSHEGVGPLVLQHARFKDSEAVLARFPVTLKGYAAQIEDNFVNFVFASTWPERETGDWSAALVHASRWLWCPLIAFLALGCVSCRWRYDDRQGMFVLLTALMIIGMFLQYSGVMEARFRKPLEPMIIMSAFIILKRMAAKKAEINPGVL